MQGDHLGGDVILQLRTFEPATIGIEEKRMNLRDTLEIKSNAVGD